MEEEEGGSGSDGDVSGDEAGNNVPVGAMDYVTPIPRLLFYCYVRLCHDRMFEELVEIRWQLWIVLSLQIIYIIVFNSSLFGVLLLLPILAVLIFGRLHVRLRVLKFFSSRLDFVANTAKPARGTSQACYNCCGGVGGGGTSVDR